MTTPWMIAFGLLTVLVLGLGLTVVGLLRRTADLLERAEAALRTTSASASTESMFGVPVGSHVRPFFVTDRDGRTVSSAELLDQPGPVAVLLMEPGCGACENLAEQLGTDGWDASSDGALLAVLPNTEESRSFVPADITVGYQDDGNVALALDSNVSPHVLVLDRDGRVLANDVPLDLNSIRGLLRPTTGVDTKMQARAVSDDSTYPRPVDISGPHVHDLMNSSR